MCDSYRFVNTKIQRLRHLVFLGCLYQIGDGDVLYCLLYQTISDCPASQLINRLHLQVVLQHFVTCCKSKWCRIHSIQYIYIYVYISNEKTHQCKILEASTVTIIHQFGAAMIAFHLDHVSDMRQTNLRLHLGNI